MKGEEEGEGGCLWDGDRDEGWGIGGWERVRAWGVRGGFTWRPEHSWQFTSARPLVQSGSLVSLSVSLTRNVVLSSTGCVYLVYSSWLCRAFLS